jgi:U3 small nucleolar RNA-associated protein 12
MSVQFVPNTHYFFSSGKDGIVKFWDADIRECVMIFNHHHAEVLALAVSRDGETMCSGSRDRSIRVYVRGDEPVFLEEQRQLALEKDLDAQEMKSFESGAVMGDTKQIESARVSRLTKDTVDACERLVEMIELLEHEDKRRLEHAVSVTSALTQGLLVYSISLVVFLMFMCAFRRESTRAHRKPFPAGPVSQWLRQQSIEVHPPE